MGDETTTTRTRTYFQILEQEATRLGQLIGQEWVLFATRGAENGSRTITLYHRSGPGQLNPISEPLEQMDFVLWLDGLRRGLELKGGAK